MTDKRKRDKDDCFKVDELRACKRHKGEPTQYLIKWTGYDEKDNTWEPTQNILDKSMIAELKKREEKKEPRKWSYHVPVPVNDKVVGWYDFDRKTTEAVEAAYVAWLNDSKAPSSCLVDVGKYKYKMDFDNMTQRNETHRNHTVRQLRRV